MGTCPQHLTGPCLVYSCEQVGVLPLVIKPLLLFMCWLVLTVPIM